MWLENDKYDSYSQQFGMAACPFLTYPQCHYCVDKTFCLCHLDFQMAQKSYIYIYSIKYVIHSPATLLGTPLQLLVKARGSNLMHLGT